MAKLSKKSALLTLHGMMYDAFSNVSTKTARENKRLLRAAFEKARASKMNVYRTFQINDEIVRFEIKGVHLRKEPAKPRYPYASVIYVTSDDGYAPKS